MPLVCTGGYAPVLVQVGGRRYIVLTAERQEVRPPAYWWQVRAGGRKQAGQKARWQVSPPPRKPKRWRHAVGIVFLQATRNVTRGRRRGGGVVQL